MDQNLNGVQDKGEIQDHFKSRLVWLGIDYYSRTVVKGKKSLLARLFAGLKTIPEMAENYGYVCKPGSTSADGRQVSDFGSEIYPEGMLDALKAMQRYGRPMYVMENGIADAKDTLRPRFIVDHLKMMEKAITEEEIDVKGYFHWALTDNYEWAKGFTMKLRWLYEVELKTKNRKERKSAKVYKNIIANGSFED